MVQEEEKGFLVCDFYWCTERVAKDVLHTFQVVFTLIACAGL